VKVHLEVAQHLLLALLQAALRSIRIEGADEIQVGKLQLMEDSREDSFEDGHGHGLGFGILAVD